MSVAEIAKRMDELLAELPETSGATRKGLVDELRLLNRRKLAEPRIGWDAAEWAPVPVVQYVKPGPPPVGDELNMLVKLLLRLVVSAVERRAAASGGELQFVGLFSFDEEDDGVSLSLICPFEEPRRFMFEALRGDQESRAAQFQRVTERELLLKCSFPEKMTVPLVFVLLLRRSTS